MRWIILTPLFFLLSACIYTEGEIIEEPQDIIISPKIYQYTPGYPCHATNVTTSKRITKCPPKELDPPITLKRRAD